MRVTRLVIVVAVSTFLLLSGCSTPPPERLSLQPGVLERDVRVLAAPSAGGRMAATSGNRSAREYITRRFERIGLTPAGKDGYDQPFGLPSLRSPSPDSTLRIAGRDLAFGRDFLPMAAGANGSLSGPVVFVGYGLQNPWRDHDDYAGLDMKGKVALALLGEPHTSGGKSKWALPGKWTRLASLDHKLQAAADAGASGILFIAPERLEPRADPLDNVRPDLARQQLPAARVRRETLDALLAEASLPSIAQLTAQIHRGRVPTLGQTPWTARGRLETVPAKGHNVVGLLPATEGDPATRETIVVGAHYDHHPHWPRHNTKDRGFGVRPGADDNASGIAALLAIAADLASVRHRRRDVLFVAFDAEEIGFLGSTHFVADPPVSLGRIRMMVNFDQVGRLANNVVYVLGAVREPGLVAALAEANRGAHLTLWKVHWREEPALSDNVAFEQAGVPTLFFFTGLHGDYHRRTDEPDTVNYRGISRVAWLAAETLRALDASDMPH